MLIFLIAITVLAGLFAMVEIQIEGPNGWAKNLPTWRVEDHWLLHIFWGGRAMTGYHAWIFAFMTVFFHLPLLFFGQWDLALEGRVLGAFFLFWIIEDFLWFVFNPGYGIKKFNKANISWHPRWIIGAPIEYWIFIPIGVWLIYRSY